jgi:hypothetical protein
MKKRMSFIVLSAEILAIVLLHAIKLNHEGIAEKELGSRVVSRQSDFPLKQTFTASYLK